MYMLKVKKKGFHLLEGKSYLCLEIINTDQAMLVGEDNNITVANIFDCQFAGMVEVTKPEQPVPTPTQSTLVSVANKKAKE